MLMSSQLYACTTMQVQPDQPRKYKAENEQQSGGLTEHYFLKYHTEDSLPHWPDGRMQTSAKSGFSVGRPSACTLFGITISQSRNSGSYFAERVSGYLK